MKKASEQATITTLLANDRLKVNPRYKKIWASMCKVLIDKRFFHCELQSGSLGSKNIFGWNDLPVLDCRDFTVFNLSIPRLALVSFKIYKILNSKLVSNTVNYCINFSHCFDWVKEVDEIYAHINKRQSTRPP